MNSYVILLRGINVGGKNKVPMAELRQALEEMGFKDVSTFIASGNVILRSDEAPAEIKTTIEEILPKKFKLHDELIKVLVLSRSQLQTVVNDKPKGFGEQPDTYHSDVIYLMDIESSDAIEIFTPRDGVDTVWRGQEVIYSQRLSAERTKSRLNRIMASPMYKSMTIRTWNTTNKLLEIIEGKNNG